MTALATNPPVELGRYRVGDTERLVRGQRVDGVVRVTDIPATAVPVVPAWLDTTSEA